MPSPISYPVVSVILPNYNHARYLPKRIESILGQTYADFEVLILDDCSPDNSRDIIAQYELADNRVRVLLNEKNSGSTFKQWQKGLAQVRGKYIWIAESDDFAEPSFLAELVPLLEADDAIGFAYSNSTIVDEQNTPQGTTADWKNESFKTAHWSHDFIADGQDELAQYLSKTCTVNNASAVLFRRSSIEQAGGVDTTFRYTGDWLMYIKLSLVGKVAYRAACLSNYREHSANASKKSIADSSQLFERQRCFAFVHRAKALPDDAKQNLLTIASKEYLALTYNLLRRSWQPAKLLSYMGQLWKANARFLISIQLRTIALFLRGDY